MTGTRLSPGVLALLLGFLLIGPAAGGRHAAARSPAAALAVTPTRAGKNSTRTNGTSHGSGTAWSPEHHQQRVLAYLKGHGSFDSDTSACANIESRSCSRVSECRGCLGLYTCNIPLARCELKGVSRKTGGFIQTLQNHWMTDLFH